ncbi:TetR/AcrR family transcriptional regulator [Primorskyibacter sp. S87]|uniref:TetR/AcrR family transcriptional regulator n=1 Tax=Primorskyibacter sp. S87 TaxID=3415126 RepID=UPI003C7AE1C2
MSTRQVIGLRREVTSKQERGVQRRKRLVEAARHFLETRDPQEISFKEIAKHAEVPEGSAYHFFANKYDLFSSLAAELGQSFVTVVAEPFEPGSVGSWQEFFARIIDRSCAIYRSDLVARKILLGVTMPNEVKHVDQENIEAYVAAMEERFYDMFDARPIPKFRQRLNYALTMIDAIFELDFSEHGNLTDDIVEEAKLMMIGYLAHFIPENLEMKK